jgi:glycosyltransferase involved in cell wall biosynthesis
MKKVLVRAPLLSVSGYGVHSRQVFEWAKSIDTWNVSTQVLNWGNTTWYLDPSAENGLIGEIMSRTTNQAKDFDISIQVQLPNEWDPNIANYNIGITAAVETDKCNPAWIDAVNSMSLVIVPSEHVKRTLTSSGNVTTPIHVIGEWFIPEILTNKNPLKIDLSTKFNFLIVSQMTAQNSVDDRKNILDTLKWMLDVFKDDKDVGIVLKTNFGRGTKIDRKFTQDNVEKFINQHRKGQFPRIYLLHGTMSSEEIASLYRHPTIKCYVNLTRGEGFGLPILEAAAAEIPVIATNWSAHLDFMKLGKFVAIDYTLVDIPASKIDNNIFVPNTKWAQPLEADFKKRLQKFRGSYETPKQWARELSHKCIEKFSKTAILKQYDDLVTSLEIR